MEIRKCYLTNNDCYQRNINKADSRYTTFQQRGPQGVMVHSTGANNPTLRRYLYPDDGIIGKNEYNNHWNKSGLGACVHAFIGKDKNGNIQCYQTLPWTYRGWHCGADANNTHVAFEICEDGLNDRNYFEKTYNAAVELTAHICSAYKLDPLADGVVISHAEGARRGVASNHADVGHWWDRYGVTMTDFRADVAKLMWSTAKPWYRVRKSWADKDSQIGAFVDLNRAIAVCPAGYSVFDPTGKPIYSKGEPQEMTEEKVKEIANEAAHNAVDQLMKGAGTGDKPAKWATEAAEWAKQTGLIQGIGGGDYAWNKPVTRQELAVILYRLQTERR